MFKFTLLLFASFCALSNSIPLNLAEDENGEHYLMVPLSRTRRESDFSYDISKGRGGTRVELGQQGTVLQKGFHTINTGASVAKTFNPNSPTSFGANVGYAHERTGHGINVAAQRTPGYGTDLSVQGKYNIWKGGKASLDAVTSYNRHYGGPFGASKPNVYGGIQFTAPFGFH
ncbi:hypothetical protein WA026_009741 [Henosepilachna vigintioctopunctata]|uniref:Attacin C-terminal domain-containing protein n=1 Tax=Henosepilachna vigintioctopunctata TaxID=420089 RepID=A0AAW1TSQ0_9CUCU